MKQLFRDPEKQKILDKEGWLSLPFLNSPELQSVTKLFEEFHPDGKAPQMRDGIHMTIWCSDFRYKTKIRDHLKEILFPAASRLLREFRILSPVFIAKEKGLQTKFPVHQDWSVVDESKHTAFNIWIPLHNTNFANGGLWVVPGSHLLPTPVRGPGFLFPKFYEFESMLRPGISPIDLNSGEAIIFYHRLLHGSPPNQTDSLRLAVSFTAIPLGIPLHIYFQKDASSALEVYHPDDDFIYQFENVRDETSFHPPQGKPAELKAPYQPVNLTAELLSSFIPKTAV